MEYVVAAIAWIGAEVGGTMGAYMIMYAAEIAAAAVIVGGLAYSDSLSRAAKSAAKDQYNAAQVDRLNSVVSTMAPRELVVGRVRKAGTIFYRASTGPNSQDLYLAIALAGHEVDAIEEIYLNDVLVTLDGSGNVTTAPYALSATKSASASTGVGMTATLHAGYVPGSATASVTVGSGWDAVPHTVSVTVVGLVATTDEVGAVIQYQYTESSSTVQITKHLGASGQVVDAALAAAFPADWLSTHVVAGVAYLVVKLTYNETAFPASVPSVSAVVRGAKLYDPRTGTTVWSENPALMLRHVYTHAKFGKATATAAEEARLVACANACDMSVYYVVDGIPYTQALFRAACVIPYGTPPKSAFDDLVQAMGGSWAFAGGELYVKAGVYTAPVLALTDDDLAVVQRNGASETQRPIAISVHREQVQKFNTVKAKIWDQQQDYKQVSLSPLVGSALLARDGLELVQEVDMPAVGYAPQALHIAGIMMRDARDALVVDLPFKLRAYPLELFDTVTLTLARYGWSAKTFQVLARTWNVDGSLQLMLKETAAAITQMDAGFAAQGFAANTNLPEPWSVEPLGALTLSSGTTELLRQQDGTIQSRMRVSWAQSTDMAVRQGGKIEVQYRAAGSSGPWAALVVPGDETQVLTSEVKDLEFYIVRARSRTTLAVGDWGAQVRHQVLGKTLAPTTLTVATATADALRVKVAWTFIATELDTLGVEIWYHDSVNNVASAAKIATVAYPATEFLHTGLTAGQGGYYWTRVVDTTGNLSGYYPAATSGLSAVLLAAGGNAIAYAYKRSATTPPWSTPATDSPGEVTYTFGTGITIPATNALAGGWFRDMPAANGQPLYVSQSQASSVTGSAVLANTTWSPPVLMLQDGDRGSLTAYLGGTAWTNGAAQTAVCTAAGVSDASANLAVGDTVTISDGPTAFAQTKYWSGSAWVAPDVVLNGNLIVDGTITVEKLNVTELSAVSADTGALNVTGDLTMSDTSAIKGGQSDYNTGIGFFLGYSSGAYKVSIGGLTFDGTTLSVPASNLVGGITASQFSDDHLIINPDGTNIDVELRFNRTTGGSASMTWNGALIQCSKPFVPVELGIHNISATAPSTTFAGQIWVDAA